MPFVSVTRLRLRSVRFAPRFARHTLRTLRQVRRAEGFIGGALLADRGLTFWTVTIWRDRADMRGYMASGAHLKAMPFLPVWCDEASIAHWDQPGGDVPSWRECDARMRADGHPSKVLDPSAAHADLSYRRVRPFPEAAIRPAARVR